jgi:hypothetical protein
MTDGLPHVVVTYAQFLERRRRRARVASELSRQPGTPIRIVEMRDTLTCRILPRAVLPVGVTSLFPTRSS